MARSRWSRVPSADRSGNRAVAGQRWRYGAPNLESDSHRGRFPGRVAIVTGSSRGIGLAIARRLVEEGARVCLTDFDARCALPGMRMGVRTWPADVGWPWLRETV